MGHINNPEKRSREGGFEEKANQAFQTLRDVLDKYEREKPSWLTITVLELMKGSIKSLATYIEDEKDPEVSWREPVIQLRYPVEVAWDEIEKGYLPVPVSGTLTPEDFENRRAAVKKLTELVLKHKDLLVLRDLTKGASLWKRGGEDRIFPSEDDQAHLDKLPESEAEAYLREIGEPFTIGADVSVREDGIRVFRPSADKDLSFTITTDDGQTVRGFLLFEFLPLRIDEDERRAYYPIVAGVMIIPPAEEVARLERGELLELPSPASWSKVDRQEFWGGLLGALQKSIEDLSEHRSNIEAEGAEPPFIIPTVEPERRKFPVAFVDAPIDNAAQDLIRNVHKIRLPTAKKWSSMPSWDEIEKKEIARLLEEEGEDAFTGTKLLKRGVSGERGEVIKLTKEAEKRLMVRAGYGKGFRRVDKKTGEEFFTRIFQVGGGYLEVGLSWFGMAGPWVDEWREDLKEKTRQESLFDSPEIKERVVYRSRALEDGRKIMEVVLGEVGVAGRNLVSISAQAFRVLLKLENNKEARSRIEGALRALQVCNFKVTSFDMAPLKGGGSFLGEWWYRGAGAGAHSDGTYHLFVLPGFIGCLSAFESGKRRLDSGHEITYLDFARKRKQIPREALEEHGWTKDRKTVSTFSRRDSGAPFYSVAQSLSDEQDNLVKFLEREETLRRDGAAAVHKQVRVRGNARDANEPRLYGRDFCPILPEKTLFHGALGHFKRRPESGRTLAGTGQRETETGGKRAQGLLNVMGYTLKSGAAHKTREKTLRSALADFRTVVVDYLEGIVAARDGNGRWYTLDEAERLPPRTLLRPSGNDKTTWFFFLPTNWKEIRHLKWEEHQAERARKGETPYQWEVSKTREEAELAQEALVSGAVDHDGTPLRYRLRAARLERELSQEQVGALFGVSKMTVSNWEAGPEEDPETGRSGKHIPAELVPLVTRWIETEEAPTEEALSSRQTRRAGVRKGTSGLNLP